MNVQLWGDSAVCNCLLSKICIKLTTNQKINRDGLESIYIYNYNKTRMSKHGTICARTKAAAAYYLGYTGYPICSALCAFPDEILQFSSNRWYLIWKKTMRNEFLIGIWTPAIVWTMLFLAPANSLELSNSSNIYHHEKITVSLSGHTPLASECQCHAFAPGEKIALNWWVSARWCLKHLATWIFNFTSLGLMLCITIS